MKGHTERRLAPFPVIYCPIPVFFWPSVTSTRPNLEKDIESFDKVDDATFAGQNYAFIFLNSLLLLCPVVDFR